MGNISANGFIMGIRYYITGMLAAGPCLPAAGLAAPPETDVAWLREHAVKIRTLDPEDDDFADLQPLGAAIGNARVVLLGEASHGDGAAFLAKSRLVKFLHQRKSFDVLIWESGFYDCVKAGQAMAAGGSWREAFDSALLDLWSKSDQCRPVMEYVHATQRTDRPIALVGMAWYVSEKSRLFDDIVTFFEAADPALPTGDQRRALTRLRKFLEGAGTRARPKKQVRPPELAHIEALLDEIERGPRNRIRGVLDEREIGIMQRALRNLLAHILSLNRPLSRGGASDNPLGDAEGRNTLFWARRFYPNRKLIVWAHNGHLVRGASQIEELGLRFKTNETVAAGQHIHDALKDNVYSILFLAHGGKTGIWWDEPRELPAPPDGSIEDLLHRTGLKRAFVNLRSLSPSHRLRRLLVARPIAHQPMRADWGLVCDGLFFIDTMQPSTNTGANP